MDKIPSALGIPAPAGAPAKAKSDTPGFLAMIKGIKPIAILAMNQGLIQEPKADLLREAIRILEAWQIPFDDQPGYLGLPQDLRPRDYNRLRLGTARPADPEVYERAALIGRIHRATLTLFPFSEPSANLWVQVPQRPFGGISALDMMRLYGLKGMKQVELAVDSQFDPLLA